MDSKTYDDKVLEMYVNRCIDNIIKHELIEGVTDLKSFADFALQLDLDDDRLVESIGQGAAMTYEEMSNEEKNDLENHSCNSLYWKEHPMGGVAKRRYKIEEWSAHLLTLVHNRIRQLLKQEVTDII